MEVTPLAATSARASSIPFLRRSFGRRRNLYLDQADGGAFLEHAVGFAVESCSTSPPTGLGVLAVMPASFSAAELTTATWPEM